MNVNAKEYIDRKKQLIRHLDLWTNILEQKKANDFKSQLEIEVQILQSENSDEAFSYVHTLIDRREPNKYRVLQLLCLFV